MEVRELIARCIKDRNDTEAWSIMYHLIEEAALPAIRKTLHSHNADLSLADDIDILQELCRAFLECDLHPLQVFWGTCEPQLRAYLRIIARRFAVRILYRWQQQRRLESVAVAERPCEREGPTEREVGAVWEELECILTDDDRAKLGAISPSSSPRLWPSGIGQSRAIPSRTMRHWRIELYRKYANLIA